MKKEEQLFKMTAKTMAGLEPVLEKELLKLGAQKVEAHNRAVSFEGDKGFMYKANVCLRTALRILKPIHTFKAENEVQLYGHIFKMQWEDIFGLENTFAIDSTVNSTLFNHSKFISQKAKDAIADRFRDKFGKRPSVDLEKPDVRINLHVRENEWTVSLDSSGESLHKRGYREETGAAPINEVLAAGLVMLTGWTPPLNFVDPMCGSGTIAIEAALIANNIPAGYYRKEFGFEKWKDFDADLFQLIMDSAVNKISDDERTRIYASDINRQVLEKAEENIRNAKVEDTVKTFRSSIEDFTPPPGTGTLIINPPYGERMGENVNELYKSIGDVFKKKYAGYDCWLITSNMEAIKHIGLKPTRKITVFNGPLECKFLKYSIYEGTKKVHKLEGGKGRMGETEKGGMGETGNRGKEEFTE